MDTATQRAVKATIKNLKTGKMTYQIFRQLPHDPKLEVGKRLSNWQLVIAVEEVQ
jgi:hypothetical protein